MCNMISATKTTDPRGPLHTITAVERTPEANIVRFSECSHAERKNASMDFRVGEKSHCFSCRAV